MALPPKKQAAPFRSAMKGKSDNDKDDRDRKMCAEGGKVTAKPASKPPAKPGFFSRISGAGQRKAMDDKIRKQGG